MSIVSHICPLPESPPVLPMCHGADRWNREKDYIELQNVHYLTFSIPPPIKPGIFITFYKNFIEISSQHDTAEGIIIPFYDLPDLVIPAEKYIVITLDITE